MSIVDRFMAKVEAVPIAGCWIWMGALVTTNGYGRFGMAHKDVDYAHRAAYRIFVGPIPHGLFVCHRCDVRCCVNWSHLFIGTPVDNMQDALRKGRIKMPPDETRLRAEMQPMAKLRNDQVLEIRRSTLTQKSLADHYGVSQSTISLARRHITYPSVM